MGQLIKYLIWNFLQGINLSYLKNKLSIIPQKTDVLSDSQWQHSFLGKKSSVEWWSEEKISDDDFLNIIENLVKRKIIVV